MIVCHCHAVTDRTIRACARAGACSVEAIGDCTGAGTHCGGCQSTIEEIVRDSTSDGPGAVTARRLPVVVTPSRAA